MKMMGKSWENDGKIVGKGWEHGIYSCFCRNIDDLQVHGMRYYTMFGPTGIAIFDWHSLKGFDPSPT